MPRHFYLRDNSNIPVCRISYYLPYLLLRIKPTVRCIIIKVRVIAGVAAHLGLRTYAAHFCKLWIFLYLYAPALVIGKVPVKIIELVSSHYFEVFLDKINIKKVTRHIEMHTAVCKARIVFYNTTWYNGIPCTCRLYQLYQRFHTIKHTGITPFERYVVFGYLQLITLRWQITLEIKGERDHILCRSVFCADGVDICYAVIQLCLCQVTCKKTHGPAIR